MIRNLCVGLAVADELIELNPGLTFVNVSFGSFHVQRIEQFETVKVNCRPTDVCKGKIVLECDLVLDNRKNWSTYGNEKKSG